jgi:L-lactate dehydrogenase complex protein LldF
MNPYTSFWTGVTPGDGPQTFHLVLLDNGRTHVLTDDIGRQTLRCIRCSACLNVCPVYERVGGHAYGSVYPGPIGAILNPQLHGVERAPTLPYASSLCGACYEVCPVAINIPEVLVHLRNKVVEHKVEHSRVAPAEALSMRALAWIMADRWRFERALGAADRAAPLSRSRLVNRLPGPLAAWTDARDLPQVPGESFRQWWRRRHASGASDAAP